MTRDRSLLGTPAGLDGPWLAAILHVLDDVAASLIEIRDRLPSPPEVRMSPVASWASRIEVADQLPGDAVDQGRQPVKISEPAHDRPPLPDPPPRAGRGASAEAWQTWAGRAGVAVADGATRTDIIAACVKAGALPAEEN